MGRSAPTPTNASNGVEADASLVVYECDYDLSCIPLYKAIELAQDELDYAAILYFLETGKWSEAGEYGRTGPGPTEQAKTWVSKFDTKTDPDVPIWSQLPIHIALSTRAPAQVISSLVEAYPTGLRCRDDKHQLPIHLALRHGASDDTIAFLLMQFPESVNALGKNDRTAIEYALRASDKSLGIIIDIFVEQSVGRVVTKFETEKSELTAEINVLKDQLTSSIEKHTAFEKSLTEQEEQYKDTIEKMKTEKLLTEVTAQKKIDELRRLLEEKTEKEKKNKLEEIRLKHELETMQKRVSEMKSPEDWRSLKREVDELKAYQFERIRADTKKDITALKSDLEKSIEQNKKSDEHLKSEIKNELKTLKKTLDRLQNSESKAKTASELATLRSEVEYLREQLKDRSEARKTKIELAVMKKALEMDLKNVEGKSKIEIDSLRKALASYNLSDLESKTTRELDAIKAEFEKMKKELNEKEFEAKTTREIADLKESLEKHATVADAKAQAEVETMKATVEQLQAALAEKSGSSDDVVSIRREVETLKEQFKKREEDSKFRLEVSLLRKAVGEQLTQTQGKTQEELLQIKQSLNELASKNLENKNDQEIAEVKAELNAVKEELKQVEKISKAQTELDELRQKMEDEIKKSKERSLDELVVMKKALVALNIDHLQSKKLKQSLEDEVKKANDRAEQELNQLKESVNAIDLKSLETKNQTAWHEIHKEMDQLKSQLKRKELDGKDETRKELRAVKELIAALDFKSIEAKRKDEYDAIKAEMEVIKRNMQKKEAEERALKSEISSLKKSIPSFWSSKKHNRNVPVANYVTSNYNNMVHQQQQPRKVVRVEKIVELDGVSSILPPRFYSVKRAGTNDFDDNSTCSSDTRHRVKSILSKHRIGTPTVVETTTKTAHFATEPQEPVTPITRITSSAVLPPRAPLPSVPALAATESTEVREQPDKTTTIPLKSKSSFSIRKALSLDHTSKSKTQRATIATAASSIDSSITNDTTFVDARKIVAEVSEPEPAATAEVEAEIEPEIDPKVAKLAKPYPLHHNTRSQPVIGDSGEVEVSVVPE